MTDVIQAVRSDTHHSNQGKKNLKDEGEQFVTMKIAIKLPLYLVFRADFTEPTT